MATKLHRLFAPILAIGLCGAAAPTERSFNGLALLGHSQAQACTESAAAVADGRMSRDFAVETCSEALALGHLSTFDRAATHNNRGIVRMGMLDQQPLAVEDFDAAKSLAPGLAESYANRGAWLAQEMRYPEALAELDRALRMGLKEPWRAYYNRGVVKEAMDDLAGAYADFRQAQTLKPDWTLPAQELARFTVVNRR